MLLMIAALLTIACTAGVAWANGGNDVSKGVAAADLHPRLDTR